MPDERLAFRRENLVRLPLPLAQLYGRAHNAKSSRERHDNAFYLFEASAKLLAITSAAAYLEEISRFGGTRVPALDRMLAQLVLPSLGQWVGILRELAKHFGSRPDADSHPWGHVSRQLCAAHKELPAMLALYQRIKNGPDGEAAGDQSCSILSLLDSLVQYRNGVFGHGAGRFDSFFSEEMGPLLFPAVNELFDPNTLDLLGPKGARLVYIAEVRLLDSEHTEVGMRELIGMQSERLAPAKLTTSQAAGILPNRVALLWPGRIAPLRLDPMLRYLETDLAEEVLFLNRDRNGRQIEYLSYTTGRTERDRSMLPELAQLMSTVTGNLVQEADLKQLSDQTMSSTPAVERLFATRKEVAQEAGDYEILSEIGRGGMGVVYLATQKSLGRLVALKTLPSELAGDELVLARFKREIRYLARCDDPHIVKVLANGTLPDGRAYYTMEYVPGSDLEMVWREVSGADGEASPTSLGDTSWTRAVLNASRKQRSKAQQKSSIVAGASDKTSTGAVANVSQWVLPELPELPDIQDDPGGYVRRVVTLVRDVASALRGLHDQGIVHRDIKPANLMLTPDGSRIVLMDFGLAKGGTLALTASNAGGLLGTLRYAAPEQLAAANIVIGPAADVRALGVTLWELLTRRRLFASAADEARLAQDVLTSDIPRLRSVDPRFDRDLDALVARATERRLADRIPNAGKLVELLQLWLDGKPLPIRPPGAGEIGLRWVREHRSLVAVSSLALIAVIAMTIASFISISAAKSRAESAFELAKRQGELAMQSLESLIYDVDEHLSSQRGMSETRRQILQKAMDGLEKIGSDLEKSPRLEFGRMEGMMRMARLYAKIGDEGGLGGLAKATVQLEEMITIAEAALQQNPQDATARNYLAVALSELGSIKMSLGETKRALEFLNRGDSIASSLVEEFPEDTKFKRNLSILLYRHGLTSLQEGNLEQAEASMARDLVLSEELVVAMPNDPNIKVDLAATYRSLADLYARLGQLGRSIELCRKGLALSEEALKDEPNNESSQASVAIALNKLGNALLANGETTQSGEHFEKSHQFMQTLHERDPSSLEWRFELSKSFGALADVALSKGEADKSRSLLEQKRRLAEEVLAIEPSRTEVCITLAYAISGMGQIDFEKGDLASARQQYEEAAAILQELHDTDNDNAETKESLADFYRSLGSICMDLGKADESLAFFLKSEQLDVQLLAENPRNSSAKENLAYDKNWLGHSYLRKNELDKAKLNFEESKTLLAELVAQDPDNTSLMLELAKAHGALGDVAFSAGEFDAAMIPLEENNRIVRQLLVKIPNNLDFFRNLGWLQAEIGMIWLNKNDRDKAKAAYEVSAEQFRNIIAVNPSDSDGLSGLANALRSLGRIHLEQNEYEPAQDLFRKDREITERIARENPENAAAQQNYAIAISWQGQSEFQQGNFSAAEVLYAEFAALAEKLYRAEPTNALYFSNLQIAWENLGLSLEKQEKFDLALKTYSDRIDLKPDAANGYSLRGQLHWKMNNTDLARADLLKAIELDPANESYQKLLQEIGE
jgi:eukaryotic-like serine/threonine-protein kinase